MEKYRTLLAVKDPSRKQVRLPPEPSRLAEQQTQAIRSRSHSSPTVKQWGLETHILPAALSKNRHRLENSKHQPRPAPCDPGDFSPAGSSVPGILQASTLEWVAMPSSRGSSRRRDRTQVSHISSRFNTAPASTEAPIPGYVRPSPFYCPPENTTTLSISYTPK